MAIAVCTAHVTSADDWRPLGDMLAREIQVSIPWQYEKRQDWDSHREIPVGVSVEGKPFHLHFHRRTKSVNHGVWKHYRLVLVAPEKNLSVKVLEMTALPENRAGFVIQVDAAVDAWGRAKIYEYGVHLGAYELEADSRVQILIRGDLGMQLGGVAGDPTITLDPRFTDAELKVNELHIRRVSNADGPVVRQLSRGAANAIEDELSGPRLTAKLNRAVDKKRGRMVLHANELSWRSLLAR